MFGTYISGPMFESAGYYAIFSASLVFATLGVLYMLIFVKESNRKQEIEPNESTTTYGTEEVQNQGNLLKGIVIWLVVAPSCNAYPRISTTILYLI